MRVYYSSWHHQSIHMLLTIPKYGRVENIAKRMHLPIETVLSKLKTLESIGLAEKKGEYWKGLLKDIHIPIHDPSSVGHQIQWKRQALADLQNSRTEGLPGKKFFVVLLGRPRSFLQKSAASNF